MLVARCHSSSILSILLLGVLLLTVLLLTVLLLTVRSVLLGVRHHHAPSCLHAAATHHCSSHAPSYSLHATAAHTHNATRVRVLLLLLVSHHGTTPSSTAAATHGGGGRAPSSGSRKLDDEHSLLGIIGQVNLARQSAVKSVKPGIFIKGKIPMPSTVARLNHLSVDLLDSFLGHHPVLVNYKPAAPTPALGVP